MKTIILDTNTLMAIGQFKIDVFSEIDKVADFKYEVNILDKTVEELEKIIREQTGKHQAMAKLALDMIKKKKIKKIKTEEGNVDDLLVDLAKKGAIVVTQDKELKERIKKVSGLAMTIRQKKKVVLI